MKYHLTKALTFSFSFFTLYLFFGVYNIYVLNTYDKKFHSAGSAFSVLIMTNLFISISFGLFFLFCDFLSKKYNSANMSNMLALLLSIVVFALTYFNYLNVDTISIGLVVILNFFLFFNIFKRIFSKSS